MRRPNTCSQQVLRQNSNQYCHVISVTQIAQWQVERKPPSASVFPENPRSIEILSSGSFTTLESKRSKTNKQKTHTQFYTTFQISIDRHIQANNLHAKNTHPRWYPNKKDDMVATQTCGKECFQEGLP